MRHKLFFFMASLVILNTIFNFYTTLKFKRQIFHRLLLSGPMKQDDEELLIFIRDEILLPPSTAPYQLLLDKNPANLAIERSEIFYKNVTQFLFSDKKNGFFIEAGALDGESMSNTLILERYQNWSGLLVEADPMSFKTLRTKNRKAWLANVCLSLFPYPTKVREGQDLLLICYEFKEPFQMTSNFVPSNYKSFGYKMRAMNGIVNYDQALDFVELVQCVPLQSLLLGLKIHEVDLLSLDIEGSELKVLRHFPFEEFNIHVIYLEFKDIVNFKTIMDYLSSKNYSLYRRLREDSVFISNKSPLLEKLT